MADVIPGLAKGATILVYGFQSGEASPILNPSMIFSSITMKGFHYLSYRTAHPEKIPQYLRELLDMIQKGQLDARVQHAYALRDWKKALAEQIHSKSGARTGKILFDLEKVAEE